MSLLVVILILLVWAVYGIIQKATPSNPPIDDFKKHNMRAMQLKDQKSRRKYWKQIGKQARKK